MLPPDQRPTWWGFLLSIPKTNELFVISQGANRSLLLLLFAFGYKHTQQCSGLITDCAHKKHPFYPLCDLSGP